MNGLFNRYRLRIDIIITVFAVIFVVLLVHLFNIQIVDHGMFEDLAEEKSRTFIKVKGNRGIIFDRNYEILTQNLTHYTFWMDTRGGIKSRNQVIDLFADTFGKEKDVYRNQLRPGVKYLPIEKDIIESNCRNILEKMPEGLNEDHCVKRFYPYPVIASQLIGFTQEENGGVIGLECILNQLLSAKTANKEILKTGKGEWFTSLYAGETNLKDGASLQLTIDIELQSILFNELLAAVDKSGAARADGVLVDPFTGEILAMASVPAFNLNDYKDSNPEDHINTSISNCYEPGSTFKIVTIAAALESDKIKPWQVYNCESGSYKLNRRTIHDHEEHDDLTVAEILTYSSNIGVSKIAQDIGPRLIYKYARDFGFGATTGIELPYESTGSIKKLSKWTDFSGPSIAMGQELAATNLQLAMAYCVIANGGYLLKPQIVKGIVNEDGQVSAFSTQAVRKVISSDTADSIMDMLQEVVRTGTGSKADIPGFSIAGKTGTAQKFVDGEYSNRDYVSAFAGIFPADNPKYVCIVSVDSPSYGFHWGNETAAPVVKNVFKRIINMGDETIFMDPVQWAVEEDPNSSISIASKLKEIF